MLPGYLPQFLHPELNDYKALDPNDLAIDDEDSSEFAKWADPKRVWLMPPPCTWGRGDENPPVPEDFCRVLNKYAPIADAFFKKLSTPYNGQYFPWKWIETQVNLLKLGYQPPEDEGGDWRPGEGYYNPWLGRGWDEPAYVELDSNEQVTRGWWRRFDKWESPHYHETPDKHIHSKVRAHYHWALLRRALAIAGPYFRASPSPYPLAPQWLRAEQKAQWEPKGWGWHFLECIHRSKQLRENAACDNLLKGKGEDWRFEDAELAEAVSNSLLALRRKQLRKEHAYNETAKAEGKYQTRTIAWDAAFSVKQLVEGTAAVRL